MLIIATGAVAPPSSSIHSLSLLCIAVVRKLRAAAVPLSQKKRELFLMLGLFDLIKRGRSSWSKQVPQPSKQMTASYARLVTRTKVQTGACSRLIIACCAESAGLGVRADIQAKQQPGFLTGEGEAPLMLCGAASRRPR